MRTTTMSPGLARAPWQLHSRPALGLKLRPATPGDVIELAALKRRVETRAYGHLGTPAALAERLRQRCSAWYLLTRIGEGDLVLLAEIGGTLIGMAAATVEHDGDELVLRLHSAYVDRPGFDAGRALTAARLEAGHRLGITRVVADCLVGADPAAARLARMGLSDTGRRVNCDSFPGLEVARWTGSVETALELVLA